MSAVGIVIVNFRTADLVVDCLRALLADSWTAAHARVWVVDGGSADGSAERLAGAVRANDWGGSVTLIPLATNGGFAAGNNAALRPLLAADAPPPYVLLLNPDTVPRPRAVRALAKFLDGHPAAGIAGSRLEDPDGTPQRSAFRFPGVASEFEDGIRLGPVSKLLAGRLVAPPPRDEPHRTDWVAGASMMVRREVFAAGGLLDEEYFLYFEETDFCRQAARAGWECWYVPASRVVHLVGSSSGVSDRRVPPKRMPAYWFESRRRYFVKNHGRAGMAAASLAWAVGYAARRTRARLTFRGDREPAHLLYDFVRHTFLPGQAGRGSP